ncbi:acyl-CoA dehydrogenase family protein [Bradyrhizobium sp. Leo170]|uniref:acyl-CoA dehydrogenase family protein n=1 Tax=Bradyrhizobium sp. Leo170 TaxID=1571199 RepID=UPI00102E4E41|nr:acyl-CoA dehydrogenase family protein [Bradyrhizobium sp. Leo170]TAI64848.1 acyl-CoA dehydrogenase [Bradyrhizobium sp. Leo170]
MNKIVPPQFSRPVTADSSELQALLDYIAEGSAARDLKRVHPYEAVSLIRQAKLGALRIATAEGGGGSSFRELFEVVIRLGEADSNVAHILRNHFAFVERYARPAGVEQRSKWLQAVISGAIVGLANSELGNPVVGSKALSTTLTPDGDGYRLDGIKYYSTGTLYSDLVLVRAVALDGAMASAIIPVDRQGVELVDDWDGFGQRLSGTGTTRLTNVRVERNEVILDAPGVGYGVLYASTLPQLYLTAVNAGILRSILRDAKALIHSRERTFYFASAERTVDDPTLHQTIGQIASNAFAAETLVLAAADAQDVVAAARDAGKDDTELAHRAAVLAAKAKVVVDELAIRGGGLLFDVGGASATKKLYNLDRHWRNARTLASHNPATYKARLIGEYEIKGARLPTGGFF